MSELPLAPVKRILKNSGAKSSSNDAVTELAEAMESYGTELCRKAISFAKHADRTTVKEADVKLAVKNMK